MLLITLLMMLGIVPSPALASEISSYTVEFSPKTAPLILQAIATKYNLHVAEFTAVAKCESNFRADALNRADPGTGSKGVFQFQDGTFMEFSKKAGLLDADVWNPWDNIEVAAYMFSLGDSGKKHWTCWHKYKNGAFGP